MVEIKKLDCGCLIYVNGAGMAKRRCPQGERLDAGLREAFVAAAWMDDSRPAEEEKVLAADRALVEHDNPDQTKRLI